MLRIAQVGPQDHLIDLGSGDGRIVITAARQFGASGLGAEIVPDLVAQRRDNARRAGVAERVQFRTQDIFDTDLGRERDQSPDCAPTLRQVPCRAVCGVAALANR